jgi:hypothetical protein
MAARDHAMSGDAQLAAEIEQIVLHLGEAGRDRGGSAATLSTTPIALLASSTVP